MSWNPTLGAIPTAGGVRFCVWAPEAERLELVIESGDEPRSIPLAKDSEGFFSGVVEKVGPGTLYRYRVDGRGPFPDPASRFQPGGVHGPSAVVDPGGYRWSDGGWRGIGPDELVIYELHVGSFTPEGTFAAAVDKLGWLVELGVNAVELMPLNDFPGRRGWGYDGVDLFAPARCYGTPDDLRRLVDEAHRLGLAVLLDVVYNHLGPDGNYLAQFSPYYFSATHRTPWGPAVNLDGPQGGPVRAFFLENALHWLHEYHFDGLRLDATHNLIDESPHHFLAELATTARASVPDRPIHLIAEDWRNLAAMLRAPDAGGWGLDGVWVDDFHHQLRRYLAGDHEGVFRDFRGTVADLAETINAGWYFRGAFSAHRDCPRGTDPSGLAPRRFVYFIQNHDRIGNRAQGERLNHQIDAATFRAATALFLTTAATPLLFMGQEWAASAPFLFFTDHHSELGEAVRRGRRHEFRQYAAFSDPAAAGRIPDCQAESTFRVCKLDWSEPGRSPHAPVVRLYRALLEMRRNEPALRVGGCGCAEAVAMDEGSILLGRVTSEGPSLLVVVRLRGTGPVDCGGKLPAGLEGVQGWEVVLSTEDEPFGADPVPARCDLSGSTPSVAFLRPGAVVLRARAT